MTIEILPATIAPFNSQSLVVSDGRRQARNAIALWLAGYRSANTRRAYEREAKAFAEFMRTDDVSEAIAAFLALSDGSAHGVVDAWRASKLSRGLSPAAINRSMAAMNSLVSSARRHGFTALRLEARGEKSVAYRDTRGPGLSGVQAMLDYARVQKNAAKSARDEAILRMCFGLGMRRGEVAELDIGNVDIAGERISIIGKGRAERETLTLPAEIGKAIARWLEFRPDAASTEPLFIGLSTGQPRNQRITGSGLYTLIKALGDRVGIKARPHGLRHSAVTAALDHFHGDFRMVRSFSRHSSLDIIRVYDDNRSDHGGRVATVLSALVA